MSGLLGNLLSAFPVQLSNKPELKNDTVEIKITAQELKDLLFSRVDPKYQSMISIEIRDNAIVLKLKLM
ncbi:MAG: hypothetical protein RXO36_08035 [Candidatus Nanopusillus acidilobi]|jgi:hypothetical protein